MDSWQSFDEKNLPEKEKFYSKLNDEHITDEEYEHAKNVWKTFGCTPLGYYHDLYVKTDVALLPTDIEMHLFIERGMRGGISMESKRYAKANNPLVDGYDPSKEKNTSRILTPTTFMDGL